MAGAYRRLAGGAFVARRRHGVRPRADGAGGHDSAPAGHVPRIQHRLAPLFRVRVGPVGAAVGARQAQAGAVGGRGGRAADLAAPPAAAGESDAGGAADDPAGRARAAWRPGAGAARHPARREPHRRGHAHRRREEHAVYVAGVRRAQRDDGGGDPTNRAAPGLPAAVPAAQHLVRGMGAAAAPGRGVDRARNARIGHHARVPFIFKPTADSTAARPHRYRRVPCNVARIGGFPARHAAARRADPGADTAGIPDGHIAADVRAGVIRADRPRAGGGTLIPRAHHAVQHSISCMAAGGAGSSWPPGRVDRQ